MKYVNHETIEYPFKAQLSALPRKTLDTGTQGLGVHASANAYGDMIMINGTHTDHGVIVATAFKPFKGKPGDQNSVRAHREKPLDLTVAGSGKKRGYGVILSGLEPLGDITLEHISVSSSTPTNAVKSVYKCDRGITVHNTIAVTGGGQIQQIRYITSDSDDQLEFGWRLGFEGDGDNECHVARAPYGQLTEGGEIEMPELDRKVTKDAPDGSFKVQSVYMTDSDSKLEGTFATLQGGVEVEYLGQSTWQTSHNGTAMVSKDKPVTITTIFQLKEGDLEGPISKDTKSASLELKRHATTVTTPRQVDVGEYIVQRNIEYLLNNCCVSSSIKPKNGADRPMCVFTDHVALPLGWNRDNYWQLRPLMHLRVAKAKVPSNWKWYSPTVYGPKIDTVLMGYLNWVFFQADMHSTKKGDKLEVYNEVSPKVRARSEKTETKDRPLFWARAYVHNGVTKDTSGIFQLDQQCYPFLALCDIWKTYDDLAEDQTPTSIELRDQAQKLVQKILTGERVPKVLQLLIDDIDREMGLIKTDETPGDDACKYGYLFSCNLLVWRTFRQFDKLLATFPVVGSTAIAQVKKLQDLNLTKIAEGIREKMLANFTTDTIVGGESKKVFAYDVGWKSGEKVRDATTFQYDIYADGNDVPTLVTKAWGFLQAPEHIEIWQNTMDWMFQPPVPDPPSNTRKAYYEGEKVSGLGSVHSPGVWPLGLYQEYVYYTARMNEEKPPADAASKAKEAWKNLRAAMQWDGTFSEAVDPDTGVVTSKAWFSWPGTMVAAAVIAQHVGSEFDD